MSIAVYLILSVVVLSISVFIFNKDEKMYERKITLDLSRIIYDGSGFRAVVRENEIKESYNEFQQ
jgi:KaiC/GvpD/RAD55 family RecA-like ATPase